MNDIVITSTYVLKQKRQITLVTRDNDGIWEFLSDDVIQDSDAMVVSLQQILDQDKSLEEIIVVLPKNKKAVREGNNWKISNYND